MSDFTTMQCPNCGGQLTFSTNALSMRCQHCGTEHMVKQDSGGIMLESYARCPMCNRNDRAEKVSAILRSQTHNVETNAIQTKTTMVKVGKNYMPVEQSVVVPQIQSQKSELALLLAQPQRPGLDRKRVVFKESNPIFNVAFLCALIGFFFLCSLSVQLVNYLSGEEPVAIGSRLIFFVLSSSVSLYLFIVGVPREKKFNQKKQKEVEKQNEDIQNSREVEIKKWERAMKRWKRLYYCRRDDSVFIPGKKGHAPAHLMIEFLYRE